MNDKCRPRSASKAVQYVWYIDRGCVNTLFGQLHSKIGNIILWQNPHRINKTWDINYLKQRLIDYFVQQWRNDMLNNDESYLHAIPKDQIPTVSDECFGTQINDFNWQTWRKQDWAIRKILCLLVWWNWWWI